jgi:hypothetical protein
MEGYVFTTGWTMFFDSHYFQALLTEILKGIQLNLPRVQGTFENMFCQEFKALSTLSRAEIKSNCLKNK